MIFEFNLNLSSNQKSLLSLFKAKTEVQRAELQQFPVWPGIKILAEKWESKKSKEVNGRRWNGH